MLNNMTEAIWITAGAETIGIVLSDNGYEKKAYIKKVVGFDEENDIKDVLQNGGKIHLSQVESIARHLKT
jgi:hypothetical protein